MNGSRLQIGGWILFSLSGVFFVVTGIVNGDPWTIIGSATWLAGVALFLLSYRDRNTDSPEDGKAADSQTPQ